MLNDITEILNQDDKVRKADMIKDNQYCHSTYYVHDLLEYIYITELIREATASEEFLDTFVCYRGMENVNWALEPGLLVNKLSTEEKNIYDEFEKMNPGDFIHISKSLDKMAKMQHFGLPTRLLDFSLNPLVALFFACNPTNTQNIQYDARVVVHISDNTNDLMSEMLCESAFKGNEFNWALSPDKLEFNYNSYSDYTIVIPSYVTEREIRQSSIFLLFPEKIDLEKWCYTGRIRKISSDFMKKHFFSIIIKSKSKGLILDQLNNIGINSMSLFADMEHSAKYIKGKYSKRIMYSIEKYDTLIEKYTIMNDLDTVAEYLDLKKYLLGD